MAILRSRSETRHRYSYGHSGLALLLHDIYRPFRHPLRCGPNQKPETMRNSNKGFQATAHKLPLCDRLRTLQSYIVLPVGRRLNPDVGCKKNE